MAITPGTITVEDQSGDANTTYPIDVGSDADRILRVAVDALTNFGSGLTALTIDGNAMTTVFELVDANGYLHREAWADLDGITGTVNLVVTFADIPDEGALVAWQPIAGVDFAAGVVDSGTEEDFNTTFSIALTGLAAGDFLVYSLSDFGDTTHTPSGVLVEDSETASADGVSLALGHFEATGASHTGGWTAGGFGFGGAWAMTPAEDAGGAVPHNPLGHPLRGPFGGPVG